MKTRNRYLVLFGSIVLLLSLFTYHGIKNAPTVTRDSYSPLQQEYLAQHNLPKDHPEHDTLPKAKNVFDRVKNKNLDPSDPLYHAAGAALGDTTGSGRGRANATLMMLARNSDVMGAVSAIEMLERKWNGDFGYPWVFLNDVEFDEEFKRNVTAATKSQVYFGLIPKEHWEQPAWIDEEKARKGREDLVRQKMPYADSISYRNMCRWNSGFFFKHPLLLNYRYYWRVEPDVRYHCNMNWDPFWYMIDNNKTYGFVMSIKELWPTIPTLWDTARAFTKEHPEHVAEDNSMKFISRNKGIWYNGCHFWSNFEIADLDFFRSEAYQAYFEHMDNSGGFYYERWGDAPIHTIAASLFLPRQRIHFFDRIGYTHLPFSRCPRNSRYREEARCDCNAKDSIDAESFSCTKRWWQVNWPKGERWDSGSQGVWEL